MKKVTRRQLMGAAAASALALKAAAQAPTSAPNQDFAQAALESHRKNSMVLASFPITMSVEPAFQFKA